MTIKEVLAKDDVFRYQLLSRLQMDCKYFLGNGQRMNKYLWAQDVPSHIKYMKEIYRSFPEGCKPEWITFEEILQFEKRMMGDR